MMLGVNKGLYFEPNFQDCSKSVDSFVRDFANCAPLFIEPDPLGCGSDEVLVGKGAAQLKLVKLIT